jgi:predicted butyrate kinase (DUF1464 family)
VRQVAKPTPKAIKKKLNNDFSSSGFSVELMVETEVWEESETATGAEIAPFALSTALATTLAVVAITAVVGTIFSSCFVVTFSVDLLSTTWFSVWSSLFFFQNPNWNQLLLQV